MLEGPKCKLKEQFKLNAIRAILVSHLNDGVVVVQLPSDGPGDRGDIILQIDYVIEFVTKLAIFSGKLDKVIINSSGG